MPMKKRTEKRLQVAVDKCTRQISLIYELKHFNDRLEATLGTRGFSRVRRVFSRCKRVYSGFCEVGCRPATQPFLMSSRNAPRRALREDTKNGCVTDYCWPRQSSGWAMEPLVADLIDIYPETANAAHVGTMVCKKAHLGQPRPKSFSLKKWGKSPGDEVAFRSFASHARASR